MSALSHQEKWVLRTLHPIVVATAPESVQPGRNIADMLRTSLPDLDDVTIGRVVLAISVHIGSVKPRPKERAMRDLGNQIVAAALELTELEWRNRD